jgi:hypothetical protein
MCCYSMFGSVEVRFVLLILNEILVEAFDIHSQSFESPRDLHTIICDISI